MANKSKDFLISRLVGRCIMIQVIELLYAGLFYLNPVNFMTFMYVHVDIVVISNEFSL